MMFWVAQVVGFVGMAMLALAYLQKKRESILAFNIASAVSWTLHFILLGALTGAAMNAVSILRAGVFFAAAKKRNRQPIIFIGVLLIFVAMALLTWQGWVSVLPLVAMTLSTVAMWQKNPQHMRAIIFMSTPFWIIYNVINHSIAGVITEVLLAVSAVVGLYLYRQKPR